MPDNFLVIRIHPDSPVDGATFSTYLEDLQIKVFLAGTTTLLGETKINSTSLNLIQVPWMPGTYFASVSKQLAENTQGSGTNFGTTLDVKKADGIAFGSIPTCPADPNMFINNTTVTNIPTASPPHPTALTLSQSIHDFAAQDTLVTFYFVYGQGSAPTITPTWTGSDPSFQFDLKVKGKVTNSPTVNFDHSDGIAVGMTMTSATGVPANTTVIAVPDGTSITLSNNVDLANNKTVTFQSNLNSGIIQHVEPVGFDTFYVPIPASVATAIIPMTISIPVPPANSFLDVTVVATRGGISIPVNNDFYDVIVSHGVAPTPDQYQSQPQQNTSLYLTLPPPPNTNTIDLTIPTDGSAPNFDKLYTAMNQALTNDTNFPAGTTLDNLSTSDCSRMAYDIVWSQQGNTLPPPPDALESLYTNPPNPGGSSAKDGKTNNLEQDRQKFEGTVSSFYATRDATAERLTKFVAAASAALFCEKTSLNSKTALLEFPVDPASSFAASVESELLLDGLGTNGASGLVFGVPAAFFYAVGASLDKSTTAAQHFQLATGDTIERLFQVFRAAEQAGSISDVEDFKTNGISANTSVDCPAGKVLTFASTAGIQPNMSVSGPHIPASTTVQSVTATTVTLNGPVSGDVPLGSEITFLTVASISSFQAARRLVALGVSAASNSPSVPVYAGTPLAKLVADWLAQTDPTPTPAPNPPPTYQDNDFIIWSQTLSANDPTGYLFLDLDTLTQGYLIPPFTASPSQPTTAGLNTLTFVRTAVGTAIGIGVGMPVSGKNIAPDTTVTKVETVTSATITTTTVTLSKAVIGNVPPTEVLTFNYTTKPVSANTSVDCPSGKILTFTSTAGIQSDMSVSGPNIPAGTTVQNVNATTVTLNGPASGDVPLGSEITFLSVATDLSDLVPVTASTTVDAPTGTTLTFGSTNGIVAGMTVFGTGIAPGTTVESVTATTVILSSAVASDVPNGSVISFVPLASSLADQIAVWLPTTTTPPTPSPTVETLKRVTASQWTSFFTYTGNSSWLPPFTQPVAPGASPGQGTHKAGYVAMRIRAFIRAVQQFFSVSSVATSAQLPAIGAPPLFDLPVPSNDPILEAAGYLSTISGSTFSFGTAISPSDLATAVQDVFPNDPAAQDWLTQAVIAINELFEIASVVPAVAGVTLPNPVSLPFSIAEALYARGFRSASDISRLSGPDFQQALTGTIAYDYATPLQAKAQLLAPLPTPSGSGDGGTFQPINTDGSLMNCVPPPCLSPTGPIAYLQEMLNLSRSSTCENPSAAPAKGQSTLGDAVSARRGPVGDLLASCANLETPLPTIDIVNECLEYLGTGPTTVSGTVYDTSEDELAGYTLCDDDDCKKKDLDCHDPVVIYAALPEYSTPATPVKKNQGVEPLVYNNLKTDFSSCDLPYSQALDVSRTYLRHLRTSRFAAMRTFRKCITEFVLAPAQEPTGFQPHLWRYPVRIDTAIEYLGITPEEYILLFQGPWPPLCGVPEGDSVLQASSEVPASELYGFASPGENNSWIEVVVQLPEFLSRTCLDYCEFLDLQKSGFVTFVNSSYTDKAEGDQSFPDCKPCCPEAYTIQFVTPQDPLKALTQLAIFIRLWRKLQKVDGARYSFDQLRDICEVLQLFKSDGTINPDFIRQLAAFQMLRDHFGLRLTNNTDQQSGATGADRTYLLALWVGASAGNKWKWAVQHLLDRVQHYARRQHQCGSRPAHFIKFLAENLDPLSRLSGFDPTSATDTWHALPTHTLRFAEVLSKIYASDFSVGEILFLFTADNHLYGDDPFPLPDENEAFDFPLAFPDDEEAYSLQVLRRKLLAVSISNEEAERWTWRHIESSLRHEFGYEPTASADPLLSIGEHFFPDVLSACGNHVDMKQRQYRVALPAASTNPAMWDTPDSPFRYDTSTQELWIRLPLTDEEVFEKLSHIRQLNQMEQEAVQSLYFAPRIDLASFAFIFSNFGAAVEHLVQEEDEEKRWAFFRHEFARCHTRSRVIAEHLAHHVAAATGQEHPDGVKLAWRLLQHLFADENRATSPWETDGGQIPPVTWPLPPNGGAFAALLGLTGTGLLGEFTPEGGTLVWNEVRGPMSAFGHEKNRWNIPVPTVLPAMDLTLSPAQARFAGIRNGFAMKTQNGEPLGGPQGFSVSWRGILLVEHEGSYEFYAGSPTPEGERPDFEAAERRRWCVTLKRGQKTWVVLAHHWPNALAPVTHAAPLALRSGAYQITVEFTQPEAVFTQEETCPQHTGFQVKYCGPDSEDHLVTIPLDRLYRDEQDAPLGAKIDRSGAGETFMSLHFTSTLRDMRRTYQRAFKALLFAHRFGLSAKPITEYGQSEIGYMLAHPDLFQGTSYYRDGQNSGFGTHYAYFNFNFLPLLDNYHAYSPSDDQRVQPSVQRQQALFDWWERIFDYVQMRKETQYAREHPLWLLFEEAAEKQPDDPAQLLRHVGIDLDHADLTTHYYQGYSVTSTDLEDERWAIRVWRAEVWIRALLSGFAAKNIDASRPDLWASNDPSSLVPGETETGNANLSAFLYDGCFENGEPRRYADVKRINDGLRDRGRNGLLQYLCRMNRVILPWQPGQFATEPHEITDLLLLDVQTGICERTSRIEEAITAIQTFIGRSRLGLEPTWNVSSAFVNLWDSHFQTYRTWERCKLRELYRENWIEWTERGKARRIEAFRFLESELRSSTLTLAAPGGLDWWEDDVKSLERTPTLLEKKVPSELEALTAPPQSATREGLATLGSPEYAARPTWLAAVPQASASTGGGRGSTGAGTGTAPTPSRAVPALAKAAADGSSQHVSLPLWMESAMKLGKRFLRVAAAGVPQASLGFEPHYEEPRTACCRECSCDHPVLVDEYYFWLVDTQYYTYTDQTDAQSNPDISFTGSYQFGFQDSYYDPFQQQSAEWQEEDQVPALLAKWQPNPAVRLAWCRVHNGQFGQPRKSDDYVAISEPADLVFLGRGGDSLYFQVTGNAAVPPGYSADPSPAGFRYDLPSDEAVGTPQAIKPPALPTPSPYPGGLLSYPFFAFHDTGGRLFPGSWFSPSMAVAEALRAHCSFEIALKWYRRAFDPLNGDCTWMVCDGNSDGSNTGQGTDGQTPGTPGTQTDSTCCDSSKVTDEVARQRAVVLHYCQTLIEWGDALMCRRSSEAFQQARLIYDTVARITGSTPRTILLPEPVSPPPVMAFTAANPPLNPRLIDLYSLVGDRLGLIRTCYDERRLRDGRPDRDMSYWGNDPLRDGWRLIPETCAEETEWCHRSSPYRFVYQIQKAHEIVGRVRELGAALLAAYEKGDAEALASIRAGQERDMLTLGISVRQDQWRDADWQVQALQQTKDVNQTNLLYYTTLYQNDLINNEIQNLNLATNAMQTRTGANIVSAIGELFHILPDSNVGAMSSFLTLPTGKKLAFMFDTIAKIMQTVADIQSATASIDLTQAGWQRRSVEWFHQMQTLPIEIHQIELQILGAQRRRDQALQELNNQQRQIENATEVLDFLRDKFTATDLYLFLQKETSALYRKMYEMAYRAADEAQRAFNFERGHTTRRFIPEEIWENLHEGLMAGERLDFALRHMEKEYLDENVREYELTKHFSLRLHFPMAYLQLKIMGYSEIEIPEWMFDLDFPGQYMRRIKNVTLTIPCVTGPYTGVHCRLTLLSSKTRIDPRLMPPPTSCCYDHRHRNEYETCPHDPRIVRQYAATEAIATSTGQNDTGMFELNFRDERYLPFEYLGAVSRWRIELPPDNNQFDFDTLTDVILHLNYTAREGGEILRRVANEIAQQHLPGAGVRYFDIRHEFPDAWHRFQGSFNREESLTHLGIRFSRDMFPFIPGHRELCINRLDLFFETPDAEPGQHKVVKFLVGHRDGQRHEDRDDREVHEITCVASEEWPDFYHGVLDIRLGPLAQRADHDLGAFRFPADVGEVSRAFLFCGYDVKGRQPDERIMKPQWRR